MKLWLISMPGGFPGWDVYYAGVIRAETEQDARRIAERVLNSDRNPGEWMAPEVACVPIDVQGGEGLILGAFNAG